MVNKIDCRLKKNKSLSSCKRIERKMGMKQIKRGEMKPTKIGEYTNIHSEKYFYWKIIPKEDRVFYALLKEGEKPNKNTGGYYNKDYLIGVKKNIKLYKN